MKDSSSRGFPGASVTTTDVASKSQFRRVARPKRGSMVRLCPSKESDPTYRPAHHVPSQAQ